MILKDKEILIGITGGISAYKICELVRLFVKEGARPQVVMTKNATRFVSPLTFETLSQRAVYTDLFTGSSQPVLHIELADKADLMVIAPATANIIGKLAGGIADDLLSTIYLAYTGKVIICPAMNVNMYNHPAVQENLEKLKKRGVFVLEPEEGELACGWEGKGRLPEPETILEACEQALSPKDFAGKKILVSAGPTREAIDPVRYISNRSSGKMGYAIARAGVARGAEVVLISGPTSLKAPLGVKLVKVESAEDMFDACKKYASEVDVIIKCAAVADFRPKKAEAQKIKKQLAPQTIELEPTPDIIAELGKKKRKGQILVGFAAETEDLIKNAQKKLKEKNLDIIVANDVTRKDAGFEADTNICTILFRDGKIEQLPKMSKKELAHKLLDYIKQLS